MQITRGPGECSQSGEMNLYLTISSFVNFAAGILLFAYASTSTGAGRVKVHFISLVLSTACLLYTSDAADD